MAEEIYENRIIFEASSNVAKEMKNNIIDICFMNGVEINIVEEKHWFSPNKYKIILNSKNEKRLALCMEKLDYLAKEMYKQVDNLNNKL